MTRSVRSALIKFVGRLPGTNGSEMGKDSAPIDPALLPLDLARVLAPRFGVAPNRTSENEMAMFMLQAA